MCVPAGNSDKGPVVKDTDGVPLQAYPTRWPSYTRHKVRYILVSDQTSSKHPKLFKGSRNPKHTPANNHPTLVRLVEVYQTIHKAYPSVADPYQRIPKIIQLNDCPKLVHCIKSSLYNAMRGVPKLILSEADPIQDAAQWHPKAYPSRLRHPTSTQRTSSSE